MLSLFYSLFVYEISYYNTNLRDFVSALFFGISTVLIVKNFRFTFSKDDLETALYFLIVIHITYLIYLYVDYGSFGVFQLRIINDLSAWFSLNTYFNSVSIIGLLSVILLHYNSRKLLYWVIWFAILSTIVLSVSRQALLVFLITSIIGLLRRGIHIIYLFLFSIILAGSAAYLSNMELFTGFERWENINVDSYRLKVYLNSLEQLNQHPLGIGIGNYILLYHRALESSYVQFVVELGLFGICCLVFFFMSAFVYLKNMSSRFVLISMLLLFIVSLFNEFLVSAPAALMIALLPAKSRKYATI